MTQSIAIRQTHGPVLKCRGKVICTLEMETKNGGVEFGLIETEGGAWIATTRNWDHERDRDKIAARVIDAAYSDADRRSQVMDFLEWSALAREVANNMQWKFVEWVA